MLDLGWGHESRQSHRDFFSGVSAGYKDQPTQSCCLRKATHSLPVCHALGKPPQDSPQLLTRNTHLKGACQWSTDIDLFPAPQPRPWQTEVLSNRLSLDDELPGESAWEGEGWKQRKKGVVHASCFAKHSQSHLRALSPCLP